MNLPRALEPITIVFAPGILAYLIGQVWIMWPHTSFAIADSAVPSALAHLITGWWLLILAAVVSGLVVVDECGRRWA